MIEGDAPVEGTEEGGAKRKHLPGDCVAGTAPIREIVGGPAIVSTESPRK